MRKPLFLVPLTKTVVFMGLFTALIACSFPGVYKINVQQGNIVNQEMLDKLKPGMTKQQVYFVLGKPVTQNLFDDSFDTYLYSYQQAGGETESQNITIHYQEDGSFDFYEGEVLDDHPAY